VASTLCRRGHPAKGETSYHSLSFRVCNFLSNKRGRLIAATHGGLRIALQKAYPEVDFKEWKYLLGEPIAVVLSSHILMLFLLENEKPGTQWDVATLRKWFDDFAARKGIDPLDPNNWVSIRARELRSQPVCWFVLLRV